MFQKKYSKLPEEVDAEFQQLAIILTNQLQYDYTICGGSVLFLTEPLGLESG